MFMGTGSDVGKSLIVAGLARAFANRGLKVAPFKPQNMSNNAAVTVDGGEIGRAQQLQAMAARVAPTVHMNPLLLKPETTTGAQVIVAGQRRASMSAREFFKQRPRFLDDVLASFRTLQSEYDLVLVEGAGSPAEINLRQGDLANMGFASAADVPSVLIGDIHRGGVIASLMGTLSVIDDADRARIKGFLINNFHGDPALFDDGVAYLEKHGPPVLGVVPHFDKARLLPAEDSLQLDQKTGVTSANGFKIAVPRLNRIANFDDLDPLIAQDGLNVQIVPRGTPLPGDADLVLIPGSKSTIADLVDFRAQGWDIDLQAHVRRGGAVLGLCGGYQMLGNSLSDPEGIEGNAGSVAGLGLLEVDTVLTAQKRLTHAKGNTVVGNLPITGYEMHIGQTDGPDRSRAFCVIDGRNEGARSGTGRVQGTYLHGIFAEPLFREQYFSSLGVEIIGHDHDGLIEQTLDELAAHLENHIHLDQILGLAGR